MPTTADLDQRTGGGRRQVPLLVLSDIHLGSISSRAQELLAYLDTIEPAEVILNGDILDLWAGVRYPESHQRVLKRFASYAASGIPVTYLPGNHDEALRLFGTCAFAGITIVNETERVLAGRRTLFMHGDLLERATRTPRWMTWIATGIYDLAMAAQDHLNRVRCWCGWAPIGFVQKTARTLPIARGHVQDFEHTCRVTASERGYQAVVVGHIHCAKVLEHDDALYLNSGDWVESMTALEFDGRRWRIAAWTGVAEPVAISQPVLATN